MRVVVGLALGLLFAVSVSANPLLGAWKSDRALTLQRLDIDKVTPEARKFTIEKVDLGNAVVEYHANEYVWTLGKTVRRLPYKIISIEGHYVEIQYFRHESETTPTRMRLFVEGDLLYTPIYEGGFYEVFRRVPPAKQAGR